MNELENLRQIGLKEVARKTHIEPEYLNYIIDKNYEKLTRFNAKGYIKILQREYELDLSEWLAGYDAFLAEHEVGSGAKMRVSPKFSSFNDESRERGSSGLGQLFWLIALLAVGAAAYYSGALQYLQNLTSLLDDENQSATYSTAPSVNEAQRNIIEANVAISQNLPEVKEKNLSEESSNAAPQIMQSTQAQILPSAQSAEIIGSQSVAQDQNAGTQTQALERLTTAVTEPKDKNETAAILGDRAVITPKQRVWIGVINLQTGKKVSYDSNSSLTVDLSKRQLIVCGNGNVELKVGDKVSKFDGGKSARFLVENGAIKQISYDEFIEINKGKSW